MLKTFLSLTQQENKLEHFIRASTLQAGKPIALPANIRTNLKKDSLG
jgi:hypothetical protein